jgi:hypothetical protein
MTRQNEISNIYLIAFGPFANKPILRGPVPGNSFFAALNAEPQAG